MPEVINLDVYGLKVRIQSQDTGFMRYVLTNMCPFHDSFQDKGPQIDRENPDLSINFSYLGGHDYTLVPPKDFRKAGSNLWIGKNGVIWRWRGLEILATHNVDTAHLEVQSYFHERSNGIWSSLNPKRLMKKIINGNQDLRATNHHFAARFALHLPLIYLLCQKLDLALIHGSSVQKNGLALVFTGLGGCGKSTLATYFSKVKHWKHVCDNFALTDGKSLYPYPENPRVGPNSLAIISRKDPSIKASEDKDFKTSQVSGKRHLKPTIKLPPRATIAEIHFLTLGKETRKTKMSSQESHRRILAINDYLGEFPEYTYLRFLPSSGMLGERTRQILKKLFDNTDQYDLVQKDIGNLEETFQIINRGISNEDR